MNFVTAPLIADLFLLAILAIGREDVHDGTIGANNISPIDIMLFFLSLAYIAISIDASGIIRYLAFKVLQLGGNRGRRLFFYLYVFFFLLSSFIGNDPVILSGTAFLAYMTRVSSNIRHPRAWIHTQFAVANIASAILVSSNPTNLVLTGAFSIKFINYTANIIVPVVVTAVVLFPFLQYVVFNDERLIPSSIEMHELSEEAKAQKPVNPNIPHARGGAEETEQNLDAEEQRKLLPLEEIMNPFLDKGGAAFGSIIMAATLITLLIVNASSAKTGNHKVFWVTLPAAFVMLCWDLAFGWLHRKNTRKIARAGRQAFELAQAERMRADEERAKPADVGQEMRGAIIVDEPVVTQRNSAEAELAAASDTKLENADEELTQNSDGAFSKENDELPPTSNGVLSKEMNEKEPDLDLEKPPSRERKPGPARGRTTLVSLVQDSYRWMQETFPTATTVFAHLPYALVPFAFSMFVLVQALVSKGWVPVFAYGWDHWVNKTGTVGAVGGMGFLSVILCNVSSRMRVNIYHSQLTHHAHG
jgi:Na+/H+ antiporter NhaD/arsenite permease-like protein